MHNDLSTGGTLGSPLGFRKSYVIIGQLCAWNAILVHFQANGVVKARALRGHKKVFGGAFLQVYMFPLLD